MEENKTQTAQSAQEKLTYEQLEKIAHELSEQNRQLYSKLQEMNMVNVFKRLDYLFKVVELQSSFKSDFVVRCIEEIESLMTLEKQEESETTESKE